MLNFKRVPQILSPEEIIQQAFKNASRAGIPKRCPKYLKVRKAEEYKVRIAAGEVRNILGRILQRIRRLEELTPFYYELINAIADVNKLKNALGALQWVIDTSKKLESEYRYKVRTAKKNEEAYRYKKEFYGRLASILKQIKAQLEFLADAREKLKNLPDIEDAFTVVISGAPNVGKSTFLKAVTSTKPKIESYPFTTQQLLLGYFERGYYRYQVIDTPGLLDRPLERRNPAEKQAVLALRYLANVVVFLFDLSGTSGFTLEYQLNIYNEVRSNFNVQIIPVINKVDLIKKEDIQKFSNRFTEKIYVCSAEKKLGLDEVINRVVEIKKVSIALESR